MKQSEILDLTDQELRDKLKSTEEEYSQLKLQHAISQLENPMRIKAMRKLIARLQTNLRKRELEAIG